jgi:hypothetical protein
MNAPKKGTRDGVALWKAIKEAELDDAVAELEAMSPEDIDGYIRANGGDPEKIRAAGRALGAELVERRSRNAWHVDMAAKVGTFRETAAAVRARPRVPRAALLRQIEAAKSDPRFRAPVAALFREKTPDASTDEELQALCDQLELLAKLHEG